MSVEQLTRRGVSPARKGFRVPPGLRRHLPFAVALLGGLALRVVVMSAYRPAILFSDSAWYLDVAEHPRLSMLRPIGYSLALWPLRQLTPESLTPIVVAQHALGLAVAVACYVFLLRRGLPAWGATLATLPLLLDPLQLVLEHFVLSDVLFEALLVAACLLLLWSRRPGAGLVVAAGLAVSACTLVRGAGSFVVVAFLLAVVCLRPGWTKVVAFAAAAFVPLAVYAVAFHSAHGSYALSGRGSRFLYARLAPIVRCQDPQLRLPSYERVLCPRTPVGSRPSANVYMWNPRRSPAFRVVPPAGSTTQQVLRDFSKRVVRAQPRTFTQDSLTAFARGFGPTRTSQAGGFRARLWLFADYYWMKSFGPWHPHADPGPASFLAGYRRWLWTPGPLLGVLLVLAAAATAGVGRARRCGDRVAIGLLAGSCTVTLLTGAFLSGFSWRYQLPQLALLPVAGGLAVAALARGPAAGTPPPPAPLRPLRRLAGALAERDPRLQHLHESGLLPMLLACLAGVVVAVAVAVSAAGSGWFRAAPAGVVGLVAGALVGLGLVVAYRRDDVDVGEPLG